MRKKIEYLVNKKTPMVEKLIKLEEESRIFDKSSKLFENWSKLFKGCLLEESVVNITKDENLSEDFNRVNIETDDYKMDMVADKEGKVTVTTEPVRRDEDVETIKPLTDEESEELIKKASEENEEDGEELEFDFDEIDEESFNEISESYMKRVYENINSFKLTKAETNDKELKLEGVINFKSGKRATTNFVFESKEAKREGKLKFVGENKQFAKGKKSFTLNCSVEGNKLVTESLNYNYSGKDAKTGITRKLYGTVKK